MKIALCSYGIAAFALTAAAQTKPLISDDFESGRIDPAVWEQRVAGNIEVKVQQDPTAHGKYLLRLHYPPDAGSQPRGAPNAGPAFAYLVAKNIPEAARAHLFGRAYMKISELPPAHTQLIFAGIPGFPVARYQEIGIEVPQPAHTGDAPKSQWLVIYQQNLAQTRQEGRGEDVWHADTDPYNKWMLVEWEFNDDPTITRLWVDGQPVAVSQKEQKGETAQFRWPAGSETTRNLVGGYREVGIGARPWGPVTKAFDILLDDIAIDTKRIGPAVPISSSLVMPDILGRWVGVAETTDEGGTKRQEKQTLDIKSEDGKVTGMLVNRSPGGGFPLQVQQDGARVNLYGFLAPDGGEHLRWKFELKDGSLVGTFSSLHDNPKKWVYDRTGAMTVIRSAPPAAGAPPK